MDLSTGLSIVTGSLVTGLTTSTLMLVLVELIDVGEVMVVVLVLQIILFDSVLVPPTV